ncbi:hypothetical protein MW290_00520 [Aquincola tertiaricarbonis]|uniref:Uncharacterized protein n=1 Tax=Aquincola tertiaricarbonis TaxID=391953 RepID=A0ABY4S5Z6_AQUTE|nr:hypothetical protein [Aquincola tertiaricarbonis]URI07143.1 hypothetical protein MW290_00520 [Aquincola tertiaricarbonis]
MDKQLHLLESFQAQGSDGARYKVMGYEHLVRDPSLNEAVAHWEPTGETEYRLDDGRLVLPARDGSLRIDKSGVTLMR